MSVYENKVKAYLDDIVALTKAQEVILKEVKWLDGESRTAISSSMRTAMIRLADMIHKANLAEIGKQQNGLGDGTPSIIEQLENMEPTTRTDYSGLLPKEALVMTGDLLPDHGNWTYDGIANAINKGRVGHATADLCAKFRATPAIGIRKLSAMANAINTWKVANLKYYTKEQKGN